jgi:hypothetical protein
MATAALEAASGKGSVRAGWAIGGLAAAMLLMDGGMKLLATDMMIANTPAALQLPADPAFYRLLGAILCGATLLYLAPRTSLIGAILLTGYLGGAIACHARVGSPLLSHTLFGLYLGIAIWAGLWLRDPRLRALVAG